MARKPLGRDSSSTEFQNFSNSITTSAKSSPEAADETDKANLGICSALRQLGITTDNSTPNDEDEEFLAKQIYRSMLKKEADSQHHREYVKELIKHYDTLPMANKGLRLTLDNHSNPSTPTPAATRRSQSAQEQAAALLAVDLDADLVIVRRAVDISIIAASRKRILHQLQDDLKLSFKDTKNFFKILNSLKNQFTSPTSCLDVKLKMLEEAKNVTRGNDIKLLIDAAHKAGYSPIMGSEGHQDLRAKFDASLGWHNPKDRGVFSSVTEHIRQRKIPSDISLIDYADQVIALEDEERKHIRNSSGSSSMSASFFTATSLDKLFNPRPDNPGTGTTTLAGKRPLADDDLRLKLNRNRAAGQASHNSSNKREHSSVPAPPDGSTYISAKDNKLRCSNCTKETNGTHNAGNCVLSREAKFNSKERNIAILRFDDGNIKGKNQEAELRSRLDRDPNIAERPARFAWADQAAAATNANMAAAGPAGTLAPWHAGHPSFDAELETIFD
jgi:hypothetical protein